ncbi:MAG: hypothetical protein RR672_01270, partial [Raoultibacter sp.]
MYIVKYGEEYLHDPRTDDIRLYDTKLEQNTNESDSFVFSMQPNHPLYKKMEAMQTVVEVEVYEDGELIFCGRIIDDIEKFYQDGTITCQGELSYFNDTIVRPYRTGEGAVPDSGDGYAAFLITQHNEQVEMSKRFTVGFVDASLFGKGNKITRSDSTYPSTGDVIKSKLLDSVGGY